MTTEQQLQFAQRFMDVYFSYAPQDQAKREAACLELQFSTCFMPPEGDELLVGKYDHPCIGFGMQEAGMGYFLSGGHFDDMERDNPAYAAQYAAIQEKWLPETGKQQLIEQTPAHILRDMPTDDFEHESGIAFWLCRMSSTHLDLDKLLTLGVPGLAQEVTAHRDACTDPEKKAFYDGLLAVLDAFSHVAEACAMKAEQSSAVHGREIAAILRKIARQKPETFHEAVQLAYLYTAMSGSYNYGRLDEYLGDFYVRDVERGILTPEQAEEILVCLWRLMIHRKTTWNARVFIGGRGRRNEAAADQVALLCIHVAGRVRDVLPQFSLRFYQGQNPQLLDEAYKVIGTGCVYPILYNDDVNIPAVQKAFGVSEDLAAQYLPYGCGEYILYHRTVGTPSDIINLLKALEVTLHDGYDPESKKQIGIHNGSLKDFPDFESLFAAYCRQVEHYVKLAAEQQKVEYEIAAKNSPFLMASLLYDDCISRGLPIFGGGCQMLGGTLEVYGSINTADSLTAIKKLVFDENKISPEQLLEMLDHNFEGYEAERRMLLDAPKYGNDLDEADSMAIRVHAHICRITQAQAKPFGLDSYLVVVINNSANTTLGHMTGASADGRLAYDAMANANNPTGGQDKNGLTAMLNSLVKLKVDIHAGSVQNIKFSKEMFREKFPQTRAVLDTYFANGGSQLMINVLGRDDLENALKEPEKYQNLIVRVGGFCARFVELSSDVQKEILSRTMY